ncbi:hypothetical protein EDB85DRAFT_136778 [Lactarius pseudohatsudake]|nr:hypothetical protein EDB85DRAFT_136778 [Lactarius pseudohatsudake]
MILRRLLGCRIIKCDPISPRPVVVGHRRFVAMSLFVQLTTIIRHLLTTLNTTIETPQNSTFTNLNATQKNATVSDAPLRMPTYFSSLKAFRYSIYALRDYLKLIVLDGALETLRHLYSASYLVDRFFITATFESDDMASSWMMFWLSSLPQWHRFHDVSVSTVFFMGRNALRSTKKKTDTWTTICPISTLLYCESWDVV